MALREERGRSCCGRRVGVKPSLDTPGSFAEVGRAFDEGRTDGDAYDQIPDASDEAPEV